LELVDELRKRLETPVVDGAQVEPRPAPALLTRREWEVAQRLMSSHRIRDIAQDLNISVHTARHHIKSTYRKLGVRSHAELVKRLLAPGHHR
jgi:DNA-binding CsgD family transcriptional regulator